MFFSHAYRERVGVEARSAARIARYFNVGQKAHFERAHALAFTDRTATIACVERKATSPPAANARFVRLSELFAHVIPKTNISRWARARGLTNRRLIYL